MVYRRLDITRNGIVDRPEDGPAVLIRPGRNGSLGTVVEAPDEIALQYNLSAGDVVEGDIEAFAPTEAYDRECAGERDDAGPDVLTSDVPSEGIPAWLATRVLPSSRLTTVSGINGIDAKDAVDRPSPREKRNSFERTPPDRRVQLACGSEDLTGRMLDLAAPFGLGYVGLIYGPHASGLTRTLQAVVRGVSEHAPDVLPIVMLLRARGEEMTDWRRRFPSAEVVVCPSGVSGAASDQTMRVADLTLECAKRQSELGRHVLLAVDSLSGLWAAMLETEDADAQREADQAYSRQRMREWLQTAGNFGGEGLHGSGLGGSITIVGTVWHQGLDLQAEEEGELHPHLRLLEHALHEAGWRLPLCRELAGKRLFPAIDVIRAYSRYDEHLLGTAAGLRSDASKAMASFKEVDRHNAIVSALETHALEHAAWDALAASYEPPAGLESLFDPA